ncbi:cell adhesion molecule CEACAM5-like [Dendrobates tinctorius]|uniref:cell adhesion molecule CEACAM5-like n=1 Tax=Dendrobates tinctorius TaxID=92724 RepID=UPI003CC94148
MTIISYVLVPSFTEPVTKPQITVSTIQPKENDMVILTCDTSHAKTITWTRRGTGISPETILSGDNSTLIFLSIKKKDSGDYQCEAQNHINETYTLTVASVDQNDLTRCVTIIQSIPLYPVINGSVTLSITGISETVVGFIWYKGSIPDQQYHILAYFPGGRSALVPGPLYNDRFSAFKNRSLLIKDLRVTDEGNYTVKIQTDNSSEIVVVALTVYEPVTRPKFISSSSQFMENETFYITCHTSHAMLIRWTKNGVNITSETKLSGDNTTLTFFSIIREDLGEYRCDAQNLVSRDYSDPYTITVVYGPDTVRIEGPVFVSPGSPVTLTCSADSFPFPDYQWKHNGTVLKEKNNKLNINNTMIENQGLYTCVVRNLVTLRTATDSVYVNVTAEILTSKTWTLREIIIGPTLAIVLVAGSSSFGSIFFYRKFCRRREKVLVFTMDATIGQISIQPIPQYPVFNGSVTLNVTGITEKLYRYNWYKGPNKNDEYEILKYVNSAKRPLSFGPLYNDRVIAFVNGSLQINNLQITDVGNYILRLRGVNLSVNLQMILTVYEPITKPKITASITQPKETDQLKLNCDTPAAAKIKWTRNGAGISSGAKLSDDNKTLTISVIKRRDAGEYRCEAGNVISSSTSDVYKVTVAYGPDKAHIEGTLNVSPGSPITLTCSADSSPSPEYQWKLNGSVLAETSNKYDISNAAPNDEGQYTCVLRNLVTLRTAAAYVYVNVTAGNAVKRVSGGTEFINYRFTVGHAFGIILGGLVIIFGIVYLYWKIVRKRRNELLENRQNIIDSYDVEETRLASESLYMGLQCSTENIYTELHSTSMMPSTKTEH